jgi:hypothetical protein
VATSINFARSPSADTDFLGLMVRSVAQRRVSNHGSRFGLAAILRDAVLRTAPQDEGGVSDHKKIWIDFSSV